MKTKIFEALKREYSPLGLGDVFLQGFAERLAANGTITDENLAEQVTAQKPILEIVQSNLDARVNGAQKKWQEEQAKAAAEAAKKQAELQKQHDELIAKQKEEYEKQLEELRKKQQKTDPKKKDEMTQEEIIEQYKAEQAAKQKEKEAQEKAWREQRDAYEAERKKEREQYEAERKAEREQSEKAMNERFEQMMAQMKTMSETNANLKTQLETINAEKAAAEKAAAAAARKAAINAKAKELGIPEWRINEGFIIAEDADEEKYTETLNGIASNLKTQLLPKNDSSNSIVLNDDKTPEKEEIDNIAKSLFARR